MDLGRYLRTLSAVRRGQVAKWPLLMALVQVDVDGLKQAAWRNWMSSAVLVEVIAALADGLGWLLGCVGRFRYHRPLECLSPWRTRWLPLSMMTFSFVNVAMQPWSQRTPTEIRAWSARSGKMWAWRASSGRLGRSRWQVWVDWMLRPLGSWTWIGCRVGVLFWLGVLQRM
jgi:hypothetical protein